MISWRHGVAELLGVVVAVSVVRADRTKIAIATTSRQALQTTGPSIRQCPGRAATVAGSDIERTPRVAAQLGLHWLECAALAWQKEFSRRLRRWLGVAGAFSRTSGADYTLSSIAAGPRLTSPYFKSGFREFVHGLAGVATLSSPDGFTQRSPTFTAGGGFDIGIFARVQIDYVRRDPPGVARNEVRATIGAVLPLCLQTVATTPSTG